MDKTSAVGKYGNSYRNRMYYFWVRFIDIRNFDASKLVIIVSVFRSLNHTQVPLI